MYVGAGQIVNAGGNENHKVTGGLTGDQTGEEIRIMPYYNFPWDYVLRYVKKDEEPAEDINVPSNGEYTVQPGDSLWGIAQKLLGNGARYQEIMDANGLKSIIIKPGQVLKIPGDGSKTISVTIKIETFDALQRMAEDQGKTIGEIIDEIV